MQRILASNRRWRAIFALLAALAPAVLFGLFRRQELRLRALVDHGRVAIATVTEVTRQGSREYSNYGYEVGGIDYDWSVAREEAPFALGEPFPVTYLPEDPSLSRPFAPYSRERLATELRPALTRGIVGGAFVFFAGAAILCHRAVRRLRDPESSTAAPSISPDTVGRWVAALMLFAVLAAGFDPKVRAVETALMGPAPLGMPAVVAASIAQLALFAPFFWVMPHLMRIVMHAQAEGRGHSKLGVLIAIVRAPSDLRRSRVVVLAGAVYFVILVAGWIALAASRGL